jgi:hypothetical protein
MNAATREFLVHQYDHLRAEVLAALNDVSGNEKFAVLLSGAYWVWIVSNPNYPAPTPVVAWIPSCLVLLLFLRWRALEQKFAAIGAYLFQIETTLELEGLGWEHHLQVVGKHWFRFHGWLFWILLVTGNAIVGYSWSARDA